ncbi:MAG: zinc ribbon domain-containing protein [Caldisphaeraceae archaeon]|nr:zinc ribbon domain-containing protein [Caldisphaeraceae archaeon]
MANKIGNVVIGEIKEIKQNIDLGKINDQNIQGMPWGLFKQKLRFKCEYYGINFREVDENKTSITCAKCGYKSKKNRKHRGLFVCERCGFVANADVNGALNILKKVVPNAVRG